MLTVNHRILCVCVLYAYCVCARWTVQGGESGDACPVDVPGHSLMTRCCTCSLLHVHVQPWKLSLAHTAHAAKA